jgi:hypothetical protein
MGVDHPQFGTFCEICCSSLTVEQCAVDTDGTVWDVCKGGCARQAGIEEKKCRHSHIRWRITATGEHEVDGVSRCVLTSGHSTEHEADDGYQWTVKGEE